MPRNPNLTQQDANQATTIEDLLDGILGNLGLPRAAPELTDAQRQSWDERFGKYDSDLALFLAAPVLEQEVSR